MALCLLRYIFEVNIQVLSTLNFLFFPCTIFISVTPIMFPSLIIDNLFLFYFKSYLNKSFFFNAKKTQTSLTEFQQKKFTISTIIFTNNYISKLISAIVLGDIIRILFCFSPNTLRKLENLINIISYANSNLQVAH